MTERDLGNSPVEPEGKANRAWRLPVWARFVAPAVLMAAAVMGVRAGMENGSEVNAQVPVTCDRADVNDDGVVDQLDKQLVREHFSDPASDPAYDVNDDGKIDK